MSNKTGEQLVRGFFGRRSGKSLKGRQAELMESFRQRLMIDINGKTPASLIDLFDETVQSIWLEIGFGGGEHLVHRAAENPDTGYIGIEPFRNGMAKALVAIEDAGLSNIRIYDEEAGPFLDWLPQKSLDGIYLLYPDPWPKTRHFKRRFINETNLDRIARALKTDHEFRFASDIDSYVEWTVEHCAAHPTFEWLNGSQEHSLQAWENWPGTRYEAKALREGRLPRYLSFQRI